MFVKLRGFVKYILVAGLLVSQTGCMEQVLFTPDDKLYGTPLTESAVEFEWVAFQSMDGVKLTGWFIPAQNVKSPKDAKATVVHFHAGNLNMTAHWKQVSFLPKNGYNVFMFDYRGYGQSESRPSMNGILKDSYSAVEYLRSRDDIDTNKFVMFGQDIGGSSAISVVGTGNKYGVHAVAVESSPFSYSALANERFPGSGMLLSDNYSAEADIGNITPIPVLIIHGMKDAVVPYSHAVQLFEAANEPKKMIGIEDGFNMEAFSGPFGEKYQQALVDFYDRALKLKQ